MIDYRELLADPRRQVETLELLAREPAPLGDGAIEELVRCLGSKSKTVQRRAADAIAVLSPGEPRLAPAVREALQSPDDRQRWGAAYALGAIDGALAMDCADTVLDALGDTDGDVRWAATALVARLHTAHPREIHARLVQLARDGGSVGRRMALYCLRDFSTAGTDLIGLIRDAAQSDDLHLRLAALSALGRLFSEASTPSRDDAAAIALHCLETDSNPGVRRAAAAALGQISLASPRVKAALGDASAQETDPSLARAARAALAALSEDA